MNCGSSVNLLAVGFIMCLVLGGDRDIAICYFVACDGGSPGLLSGTGNCLHLKVIWLEHEAELSSPSSSKAKNVWSFNLLSTVIRLNVEIVRNKCLIWGTDREVVSPQHVG
jgi:hypothetical protein